MKHIGWCLDRIQIVISNLPGKVLSQEDKKRANEMLDEVQEYADTLEQLIVNPDFKNNLHQLEKAPIEGSRALTREIHEVFILQAEGIHELFKDLEAMLYSLDLYIEQLKEIVRDRPEEWGKYIHGLIIHIDQKFGGERGDLRKEFKIALHAEEELRQLVTSEKHLAEFLKL